MIHKALIFIENEGFYFFSSFLLILFMILISFIAEMGNECDV